MILVCEDGPEFDSENELLRVWLFLEAGLLRSFLLFQGMHTFFGSGGSRRDGKSKVGTSFFNSITEIIIKIHQ